MALSQYIAKASYEICYIPGKRKKPFTDAEFINNWLISAANVLYDKFINKKNIKWKTKKPTFHWFVTAVILFSSLIKLNNNLNLIKE